MDNQGKYSAISLRQLVFLLGKIDIEHAEKKHLRWGLIIMPRTLTPNKELLLKAVESHPGLPMSQLVNLTGVPQWAAQKILPELAGRGLVYYRMQQPNSSRLRKWYAGQAS